MSSDFNLPLKLKNSTEIQDLVEEIQTVVGLNFEISIVETILKENDYEFLPTVASIIGNKKLFF